MSNESGRCPDCHDLYVPELPTHYVGEDEDYRRCPGSGTSVIEDGSDNTMSRHHLADVFGPEVADIIENGRGDIARHGRHELKCSGALALLGETYPCDLHPEHGGWAHSSKAVEAIWR